MDQERRRDIIFICLLAAALWAMNLVWLSRDTRPPVWDMAMHQSYALNYLPGMAPARFVLPYWGRSGNYPPFVHLVISFCYWIFHPGPHIAVLANVPATLLLFGAVYLLGCDLAQTASAGRWSCVLVSLVPYLIWMSRETVLDYWLAAWVLVSLVLLKKTRGFGVRSTSLLLGLAMALGMLTKWLFAGFLAAPVVYCCVQHKIWKCSRRTINFLDSLILTAALAGIWYIPNVSQLLRYFSENSRIGQREGEPAVVSFQSLIYYLRLLEGYQLFAVLSVFLLFAAYVSFKQRLMNDSGFWITALLGGWAAMTLLQTKDPRFTMPLLGLLVIPGGAWLSKIGKIGDSHRRPRTLVAVTKFSFIFLLCCQAYMANFGIRRLPEQVILARGYQGSLRWDWNLYLQNYFHILGPPRREDWKLDEILGEISQHASQNRIPPTLALIPDLPRFNAATLSLQAQLRRTPMRIDHLQRAGGLPAFEGFNYVLMTEGEQGMPWTTSAASELNRTIVDEPQVFRLLQMYQLPNGDYVRLYQIWREGKGLG